MCVFGREVSVQGLILLVVLLALSAPRCEDVHG